MPRMNQLLSTFYADLKCIALRIAVQAPLFPRILEVQTKKYKQCSGGSVSEHAAFEQSPTLDSTVWSRRHWKFYTPVQKSVDCPVLLKHSQGYSITVTSAVFDCEGDEARMVEAFESTGSKWGPAQSFPNLPVTSDIHNGLCIHRKINFHSSEPFLVHCIVVFEQPLDALAFNHHHWAQLSSWGFQLQLTAQKSRAVQLAVSNPLTCRSKMHSSTQIVAFGNHVDLVVLWIISPMFMFLIKMCRIEHVVGPNVTIIYSPTMSFIPMENLHASNVGDDNYGGVYNHLGGAWNLQDAGQTNGHVYAGFAHSMPQQPASGCSSVQLLHDNTEYMTSTFNPTLDEQILDSSHTAYLPSTLSQVGTGPCDHSLHPSMAASGVTATPGAASTYFPPVQEPHLLPSTSLISRHERFQFLRHMHADPTNGNLSFCPYSFGMLVEGQLATALRQHQPIADVHRRPINLLQLLMAAGDSGNSVETARLLQNLHIDPDTLQLSLCPYFCSEQPIEMCHIHDSSSSQQYRSKTQRPTPASSSFNYMEAPSDVLPAVTSMPRYSQHSGFSTQDITGIQSSQLAMGQRSSTLQFHGASLDLAHPQGIWESNTLDDFMCAQSAVPNQTPSDWEAFLSNDDHTSVPSQLLQHAQDGMHVDPSLAETSFPDFHPELTTVNDDTEYFLGSYASIPSHDNPSFAHDLDLPNMTANHSRYKTDVNLVELDHDLGSGHKDDNPRGPPSSLPSSGHRSAGRPSEIITIRSMDQTQAGSLGTGADMSQQMPTPSIKRAIEDFMPPDTCSNAISTQHDQSREDFPITCKWESCDEKLNDSKAIRLHVTSRHDGDLRVIGGAQERTKAQCRWGGPGKCDKVDRTQ
ncbi:hypothetical protein WOLCODRAFT_144426 [Wolfiporia cocos MD-104 SS10]|uniref:C2H2-type domain-containing protein n=1 Tax=Wolfiporia cocos (strain MD-104) TaxID=742152 RepID=A0A2H3JNX4_WOLCO|nr:hypothetical protein WOLCODRAFT_144426 [Wolfiporia cocos MD-104 SS10]